MLDMYDLVEALRSEVRRIVRRQAGMILRGVLGLVAEDEGGDRVYHTIAVSDGTAAKATLAEPYGFSSNPGWGARAIVLRISGSPENAVAIMARTASGRPVAEDGDVVVWDSRGQEVRLTSTGIEIAAPSGVIASGAVSAASLHASDGASALLVPVYNTGIPGQLAGLTVADGIITSIVTVGP